MVSILVEKLECRSHPQRRRCRSLGPGRGKAPQVVSSSFRRALFSLFRFIESLLFSGVGMGQHENVGLGIARFFGFCRQFSSLDVA